MQYKVQELICPECNAKGTLTDNGSVLLAHKNNCTNFKYVKILHLKSEEPNRYHQNRYHPNQRLEAARREIAFNNNLIHWADEFVNGINKIWELQQKLKQFKSPNYTSGTPKN